MSATDDSDPKGRLAPRDASRLSEDALDVARFCWPEEDWGQDDSDCFLRRDSIAAAERVLVERGLGEEYGRALRLALRIKDAEKDYYGQYLTDGEVVAIRTAPLEVCLRALARVVREKAKVKREDR